MNLGSIVRRHQTVYVRALSLLLVLLTLGRETLGAADALHLAAATQGQDAIAGSVVILAETDDMPGQGDLAQFHALAQGVERYYAANAYGSVNLAFRFMAAGARAWYNVGPQMRDYEGQEEALAAAAVQRAFAGVDLPERVALERVVVVFADNTWLRLQAITLWMPDGFAIEVMGAEHTTRLYVQDIVLLSENNALGAWAHELGHTLPSRYASPAGYLRLMDRYGYDPTVRWPDDIGYWDLMGRGGHWGRPEGSAPTHMSSYTKEAAGWLRYTPAPLDQEVALTAVENQVRGDLVLQLDDPASDDPRWYYILEARDAAAPYGAPESGVVLYHVAYDDEARHAVVELIRPQAGTSGAALADATVERPTLYGAGHPDGAQEYVNTAAGFRITLRAESFAPYQATIRIERLG